MKKNTQKILLALYSEGGRRVNRVSLSILQGIVPDLTDGGYRSLLHVLKKQDLIQTQRVLGQTTVSITHHGTVAIEREFPALSQKWDEWDGGWDCLVFIEAPSFDKQFRFLRKLVLDEGAVSLSRGVYLSPGSFSDVVLKECNTSYHSNVIVFSVAEWKVATEFKLIVEKYGMLDLIESFSGISKDVDRLLKSHEDKKRLIDRYKNDICLVYDRACDILAEAPGFSTHYFTEAPSIRKDLLSLNNLLSRVE